MSAEAAKAGFVLHDNRVCTQATMDWGSITRIVHYDDPFQASQLAEKRLAERIAHDTDLVPHFAPRQVLTPEGEFPYNEGYLYLNGGSSRKQRAAKWKKGRGRSHSVVTAGHQGTSKVQQDAFGGCVWRLARRAVGVVAVADGVSSCGERATRASQIAVERFLAVLKARLEKPTGLRQTHLFFEKQIEQAVFWANLEVLRQVLFDFNGNGVYDEEDEATLNEAFGARLSCGAISLEEIDEQAASIQAAISHLHADGVSALTTFGVCLTVDSHVYTFNAGDSVITLYRPPRSGINSGCIHLTARDQLVVELFNRNDGLYKEHPEIHENIITLSLGEMIYPHGTLRRYPHLLFPGDKLVASTDGIGPRALGTGITKARMEHVLAEAEDESVAQALVEAQLSDLTEGEYQDNIGVAVLNIG